MAVVDALGGKKLHHLPHIDADVFAEEDAVALQFVVAVVDGLALSTRSSSSSFQLIAPVDGLRHGDRGCSHRRFGGVGLRHARDQCVEVERSGCQRCGHSGEGS